MTRRLIAPALLAATAIGCSTRPESITITSAEYGDKWPFTIASGILRCEVSGPRELVTLDVGKGIHYGINGSAKTFGFPDSVSIHKPGVVGLDLQPIIDRGRVLCQP